YYAFIELGLNLLNNKGKLGFITPNSHFNTASGKNLRKLLKRNRNLQKIINFDYIKVFKDVNVYSCISILTKNKNPNIKYFKVQEELNEINLKENEYKIVNYNNLNDDNWVFLNDNELKRKYLIENAGRKLIDFCDINVGIATLSDYIYLLNDYEIEVDGMMFNIEPEICKPIIKVSTLHNEEEIKDNTLKIIWPYDSQAKLIPESIMIKKYPNAYNYLKLMKSKLNKRDNGRLNPNGWYAFGMTQSLKTSFGKKLLTSTMNLKPNFIYCDDEESTFLNGYQVKSKKMDLRVLQKILNSSVMEEYIEMTSKSYQSGWKSYAKNYIMNFSVPRFSTDELHYLKKEEDQKRINDFLEEIYFNRKKEVQSVLM
ncbi:Eco57I restriction-modification methylase domain-containing protein, partial [Methanobrevibacter sp.]|uniref:Eco57I restriction-modification methylase domain-containing protein n=1 Tax=Methanobrevibacter sp. TaxID=66852 RepID=UPI0038694954